MKYCLNSRLSPQYLKAADQIKIEYRDIASAPDLFEEYPDKEFIITISNPLEEEELATLRKYNRLCEKLILAFDFFPPAEMRDGFHFYTSYPVESFSEAKALIDHGVEYLRVGCPLFFQLDELLKLHAPVRFVPNQSWLSVVPRENGICGQWIRPEDVHLYDVIPNAVIEFDFCRVSEEEALFRIYKNDGKWPGPLEYLVQNLNSDVLNRVLPENLGPVRTNCGHKCMTPSGFCHICPNAFRLATIIIEKHNQKVDKT